MFNKRRTLGAPLIVYIGIVPFPYPNKNRHSGRYLRRLLNGNKCKPKISTTS